RITGRTGATRASGSTARGWLAELGARLADLADLLHGRAQLTQPLLGVLAGQADAPSQGMRAGPGHAGLDQGVQDLPLELPQPGHDRDGEVGEQLTPLT